MYFVSSILSNPYLVFDFWAMTRGGGGTLNFYKYVGSGYFFGLKILRISIFLGVFRKMNISWGMKILWIFFFWGGGHHKIGLYLGVISMHFRVFS